MSFVYTYSIQNDFPNHVVDAGALQDELVYDFAFDPSISVGTVGDVCSIQTASELSAPQKTTLDTAVAAHQGVPRPFEKKHYEQKFDNSRILRETWWARSVGDALSEKVEETLYTYSASKLMTETWTVYNRDGSVAKTRTWHFRQQKTGTQLIVRKVEQ